jgi:hypothetical protein
MIQKFCWKVESKDSSRYLYTHILSSVINSSQMVEATEVPISGQMSKNCDLYKEWNTSQP